MRPNIVIFNPDQMRADALSHLGGMAGVTPFLDAFAGQEAVSFRNAFCQNPVCVPSRCSFLTGLYPHVNGHRTMAHMLHAHETTVLRELKQAGYRVWMNARNDFLPGQVAGSLEQHADEVFYGGDVPPAPGPVDPNPRGGSGGKHFYSFYFGEKKTDERGVNYGTDDEAVDASIDFVRGRDKTQPFCVFLGLENPHPPYAVEEPYFSAADRTALPCRAWLTPDQLQRKPKIIREILQRQSLGQLSEDDWADIRGCYLGMCLKVDALFQRLCNALKEQGVYDDTAIFFFSDHGDFTGDYGLTEKTQNTFEDCLVKVPLLVKPPKGVALDAGVSDSLAELVDVYPTVMELCGVAPGHSHFGKSLLPVLADRKMPHRAYAFAEGGRLRDEAHCMDVSEAGASPQGMYYPRLSAQADPVAHTKATMIRSAGYKYVKRLCEQDEFYDLENDPYELDNQIAEPRHAQAVSELKMAMLDWYQATCDTVPFEQDSRFSFEMIWNRVKGICPPGLETEVQQKIRDGANMYMLAEWIKRQAR